MNTNEFYWGDEESSAPAKTAAVPQQETMGTEEFDWGDGSSTQSQAPQRPPQSPLSSIGDWASGVASDVGQDLQSAWAGVQHGGTELDKMGYGLYQTGREALGLNDQVQREAAKQVVDNMSNYQKAKAARMGSIGTVTSMATQMAPHILAAPITGPAGALAMGAATTTGDIAQKQIEKYGEVDPATAMQYGVGSGMVDYALNRATLGMASKLPTALKKSALGMGESAVSGAQQSVATDLGAGDEVTAGKTLASAGMGAAIRGGFEGIKYSPLNKNGLKAAEEASTVTRKVNATGPGVEEFARNAGIGKNTIAGYNQQVMDAPTMERSFEEFEKMTQYTRSPEAQDAVVSDVMTDMFDNMKGLLTRRNFDYDTADGRSVREVMGLTDRDMVKSSDIMHNVDRPMTKGEDPVLRAETTNAWLDQYNKSGMKLVTDRAGAYDSMIAKVDEQINIDTNLRQDANVDTTQLTNLKTNLSKIKEAMTNYAEGGDVRNLTEAIDIYGAQAMRYASQTGMVGKLNGVRGKGEPFNPAYDLSYMKSLNDSLVAADPNFFKRSGGDATKELGLDLRKPSLSVNTLIKEVGNLRGMGKIRKEKELADALYSDVSSALSRQPTAPITPSPAAKVETAMKAGDFDGAAKASEEALASSGLAPMKGPTESVAESSARVDEILSGPTEAPVMAPEAPRGPMLNPAEPAMPRVEEPVVPDVIQPDPFSRSSTDMAPTIDRTPEVPVEAPVRPVEEIAPKVEESVAPDLSLARKPSEKAPEPEPAPAKVEEPVKVEEPKPEPKTTKAQEMASKPKAKEEPKVEEPKAEEPKVEAKKSEPVVPVKRPTLKTVLDKIGNESKRLNNLPLSSKTRSDAITAANLKKTKEFLGDAAKRLTAKEKYSDAEVAEMIDSSILAAGGLDKLGNVADFKKSFTIDRMESDHAKRLATISENAQKKAEAKADRIVQYAEDLAKRKGIRDAASAEDKAKKAEEKKIAVKESHDVIGKYAKDEGFSDADVSSVLKKLGVTSADNINPVRARSELEKLKTTREADTLKKQEADLKKSTNEAGILKQKAEVADKTDKLNTELKEVTTALKKAKDGDRTKLIRRKEELDSQIKEMGRVREDIDGMESTEAIQKRIDSTNNKIKASERNVADLESQLKQVETAMKENGGTADEITDYLASRFDIRRLPIESIDNARNQAVKHIKKIREAEKVAANAKMKEMADEVAVDVKKAESDAEVQGIMDAVTKNITKLIKDPQFIKDHQTAIDMLRTIGNAAKGNANVDKHKANAWGMYFDILSEGARRKGEGVPNKHLVDNMALKELREEYQKMRGIDEGASTTAGRFWTDIKTVLTGDPNFKFEAESKKGALEGSGMRDKLQKAKAKNVKPKKVSIDDYM